MPDDPHAQSPKPDFSRITFPSDKITIGRIRAEQPGLFTSQELGDIRASYLNAFNTVAGELDIAERVWAQTLGLPKPTPRFSREDEIRMTNDDYVRYGISTGLVMTRQLIGDLEKAVAEKARQAVGRAR